LKDLLQRSGIMISVAVGQNNFVYQFGTYPKAKQILFGAYGRVNHYSPAVYPNDNA